MNAYQLFRADGTPVNLWVCGKCNAVDATQSWAESHCRCSSCGIPENWSTHSLDCDACPTAKWAKAAADRMAKAEKLESWDGRVYSEGGGGQDGYFMSLEDYVDHLKCTREEDEGWPEWVNVCREVSFPGLDMERIIENLAEDMNYEDAIDNLNGEKELAAAIDAFNLANVGATSYDCDMDRVVRVPRPEATP